MCINKHAIESSIVSTRNSICHFPTALMCMILSSLATYRAAKQFEYTEQDCSRANIWKQQAQSLLPKHFSVGGFPPCDSSLQRHSTAHTAYNMCPSKNYENSEQSIRMMGGKSGDSLPRIPDYKAPRAVNQILSPPQFTRPMQPFFKRCVPTAVGH